MRRVRSVAGPLRRAHPASGATWNVQVVRGKMSSRCLWHACRALSAGLLLMLLGAAMATIGYYAEQLSVAQEIRGNATVRVKDESRGFHLNNLSYAGPIVMGFGGFIVVAACVMTFEARDSAAKVTPARPIAALPRPPRRAPAAPAPPLQLDVFRPPLPTHRSHAHAHARRSAYAHGSAGAGRTTRAACGSAPELRVGAGGGPSPRSSVLRLPPRRLAMSVDEAAPSYFASQLEKSSPLGGSASSLALELHAGVEAEGAGGAGSRGVTMRVRDAAARRRRACRGLTRQHRHTHEERDSAASESETGEGGTVSRAPITTMAAVIGDMSPDHLGSEAATRQHETPTQPEPSTTSHTQASTLTSQIATVLDEDI